MLGRVRGWFDGAGWFVGLAAALFVFALLAVLLELQSPDLVLWTGHRVAGTEQGGIVTYRWDGQQYSLNTSGYGAWPASSGSDQRAPCPPVWCWPAGWWGSGEDLR